MRETPRNDVRKVIEGFYIGLTFGLGAIILAIRHRPALPPRSADTTGGACICRPIAPGNGHLGGIDPDPRCPVHEYLFRAGSAGDTTGGRA